MIRTNFNAPAADDDFEPTTASPPAPRRSSFRSLDGRRPKVKSNLKVKFRNSGKRFDSQGRKKLFGDNRRGREQARDVITKPFIEPLDGPEVKPDGREPRVKGDLLAEIRNKPDTTTLKPFLEEFFGSPSSPQPFIFRGSPDPFSDDLFPSATTVQPFFVPTPKSFSGISQTPLIISFHDATTEPTTDAVDESFNAIEEDEIDPTELPAPTANRFRTRPSPARFDRRRGPASRGASKPSFTPTSAPVDDANESVSSVSDAVNEDKSLANTRHPKKNLRKKFGSVGANSFVTGRRPRVKSNITARKRNFWQSNFKSDGGRKLRRGRKQRVQVPVNTVQEEEKMTTAAMDDQTNPIAQLESLIPTARPETTTSKPESDIFEDLFEQQDDLIVASSTVSSVVFKGSPTPYFGLFSSPGSAFDSESGVFVASPRPSFNNIGNDIDLGPKKFLSPNGQVFVTSTQSNKIFIGSSEDPTPFSALPALDKRTFPSFPIRGKSGSLSFPFRPKSFPSSQPTAAAATVDDSAENKSQKVSEITPVTSPSTAKPTTRNNPFRAGNRNFKSLFNRKRGESSTKNSFKPIKADPTPESVADEAATEVFTTAVDAESQETAATTESIARQTTETQSTTTRKRFSFNSGSRSFRGGFRGRGRKEGNKVSKTTTTTTTVRPRVAKSTTEAFAPTITTLPPSPTPEVTESSVLSVETELEEDNEIDNEILDIEEPKENPRKGFRRFSGVKKANRSPVNGNIRVEFKKAPAFNEEVLEESEEENDTPKKFFVKPDGRKPRVKSNIRARLAHKGRFGVQESGSLTGFRHSTKVHDLDFNGDPELEHVDNTEKREISHADLSIQENLVQKYLIMSEDIQFVNIV